MNLKRKGIKKHMFSLWWGTNRSTCRISNGTIIFTGGCVIKATLQKEAACVAVAQNFISFYKPCISMCSFRKAPLHCREMSDPIKMHFHILRLRECTTTSNTFLKKGRPVLWCSGIKNSFIRYSQLFIWPHLFVFGDACFKWALSVWYESCECGSSWLVGANIPSVALLW